MFSILRFILIVGAIFYYSPVRQRGDAPASVESLLGWAKGGPAAKPTAEAGSPQRLEAVWQALPESAKQAIVDKIMTTSGLGGAKAADTLLPGDRDPGWRDAQKPRT